MVIGDYMKYGESLFDILYIITAVVIGVSILLKCKNKLSKLMGYSILILGIGDSFHLIPRVLNYFINYGICVSFVIWFNLRGKVLFTSKNSI